MICVLKVVYLCVCCLWFIVMFKGVCVIYLYGIYLVQVSVFLCSYVDWLEQKFDEFNLLVKLLLLLCVGYVIEILVCGECVQLDWVEGLYLCIEMVEVGIILIILCLYMWVLLVVCGLFVLYFELLICCDVLCWLVGYVLQFGLVFMVLKICLLKSLWGSLDICDCINFDFVFVLVLLVVLCYVFVYELCYFKVCNYLLCFWVQVEMLFFSWCEQCDWLCQNGLLLKVELDCLVVDVVD